MRLNQLVMLTLVTGFSSLLQAEPAISTKTVEPAVVQTSVTQAAPNAEKEQMLAKVRANLSALLPKMAIDKVDISPFPGILQVLSGSHIFYVSADGHYIIDGQMYDLINGMENLTEKAVNAELSPKRAALIAAQPEKEMIIFPAKNPKYQLTVFTDVDCGYCRKLHQEVPKLNELGVTVRYLAFPRAGQGSDTYLKMAAAWCAKDSAKALTMLKNDQAIPMDQCSTHPLDKQLGLVAQLGLRGTPALVFEDGTLLPGYLPADELLKQLNLHSAPSSKK